MVCPLLRIPNSDFRQRSVAVAGRCLHSATQNGVVEKCGIQKTSACYSRVALVILALPPTNAYQERIFSTCTYFDDPLRQSLKFSRFEMSVLLAVNQAFLRNRIPSFEEVKSIVERVIAMFEKDASIVDAADELGFDVDAENFEAEPED